MRNVFLASTWMAATMAIALFAVTVVHADNEPDSKNKNNNSSRSNNNSGRGNNNNNSNRRGNYSGRRNNSSNNNDGAKSGGSGGSGNVINKAVPRVVVPGANNSGKPGSNFGQNGPGGSGGNKKKAPDKSAWKNSNKDGWHKNGWNDQHNSHHHNHHHGYWNNGIWIAPLIITNNRPWVYLQPVQPIISGQKWLGVTYEPYEGGGAYVNGIYEGSPAQRVGLEVGDVIVSLDGVDATQLGAVIQASDGRVVLQVLSGRTGELVELPVNIIR